MRCFADGIRRESVLMSSFGAVLCPDVVLRAGLGAVASRQASHALLVTWAV